MSNQIAHALLQSRPQAGVIARNVKTFKETTVSYAQRLAFLTHPVVAKNFSAVSRVWLTRY